jgi:hypothetical protein
MNRLNIVIWLSAGVIIGWLVSRIVEMEHQWTLKQMSDEEFDAE